MDFEKLIYLISGAIIGFALSLAKDWLMESKKQKEKKIELKRERLEELYIGFSKWANHVISEEMTLLSVMKNKITYNDYLDMKIEKTINFDAQNNEMILKVYAETLLPVHEDIMKQLAYLNHIEEDFKKVYSKQGPHTTEVKTIEGNKLFTEKFIEISDIFKTQLATEIKQVI